MGGKTVGTQVKPGYLIGALIVIVAIVYGAILSVNHQAPQKLTLAVSSKAPAKALPTMDPTTPETTLDAYITALQRGERDMAQQIYYRKDFRLDKPVPIKNYQIYRKLTYDETMVKEVMAKRSQPVLRPGDIELRVRETYQAGPLPYQNEQTETFSYFLRNSNGKWSIFAHELLSQAE